ncbi:MAG: hypothetical protein BJ554DRAFT_7842, partial [Olpidium bornovanus]
MLGLRVVRHLPVLRRRGHHLRPRRLPRAAAGSVV